jgi:adenylate cyclase class IV
VSPSRAHPGRNVELKAREDDLERTLTACRALGAEDRGEIYQRDTYFDVARGGLKLREERPGRPHLIQFERPDQLQQRVSRYRLVSVDDAPGLTEALAASIGIRIIVVKRRHLQVWRDVRIHLDEVDGLGNFIELEAVAPPESDSTHERALIAELREAFAIGDDRLVERGYADQLLATH